MARRGKIRTNVYSDWYKEPSNKALKKYYRDFLKGKVGREIQVSFKFGDLEVTGQALKKPIQKMLLFNDGLFRNVGRVAPHSRKYGG